MVVLGGLIDAIRDGMHADVGVDVLMVENVVGVVREIVDVVEMVVGVLDIVGVDEVLAVEVVVVINFVCVRTTYVMSKVGTS